jgi:MFS family permease
VVRRPEILCICLVQCAIFGWIYLIVVMLPTTLQSAYALSTDTISLVYLAGGVGDGLGALTAGFLSDRLHRLRMLRNRDMTRVEYRFVPTFYLSLPFALFGALLYGWSTQARMIYYAPLCGYVLCKWAQNREKNQRWEPQNLCRFFWLNDFSRLVRQLHNRIQSPLCVDRYQQKKLEEEAGASVSLSFGSHVFSFS